MFTLNKLNTANPENDICAKITFLMQFIFTESSFVPIFLGGNFLSSIEFFFLLMLLHVKIDLISEIRDLFDSLRFGVFDNFHWN